MDVSGSFDIDVPIDKLWKIISDANEFSRCLPNLASSDVNGDKFNLRFNADVSKYTKNFLGASYLSNLNVKFNGKIEEKSELKHVKISGNGSAVGLKFSLVLNIYINGDKSKSSAVWNASIDVGGMVKIFGQHTIESAVKDIVDQVINLVKYRAMSI